MGRWLYGTCNCSRLHGSSVSASTESRGVFFYFDRYSVGLIYWFKFYLYWFHVFVGYQYCKFFVLWEDCRFDRNIVVLIGVIGIDLVLIYHILIGRVLLICFGCLL